MADSLKLKTPIDANGTEISTLRPRHQLRMGDIAAVQRYARSIGYKGNSMRLIEDGDLGTLLTLLDSICQLPPGTCEQLNPEDFEAALELLSPFLTGVRVSPSTGSNAADPSSSEECSQTRSNG